MSNETLFDHEIEFCCKKGKWKKCILEIEVKWRLKSTIFAIIKDCDSVNIIETICVYGCEVDLNVLELFLIGKSECYFIRFKELDLIVKLQKIFKKYINDVYYYLQLYDFESEDSNLVMKDCYRFHVQLTRICLITDVKKGNDLIKIWCTVRIGEVKINNNYLTVEIKTGKDVGIYVFYHNNKVVIDIIHSTLMDRLLQFPLIIDRNYLTKRKSENLDLKRFNSCSNSREMKRDNRFRTLSSSETDSLDYAVSMSSTPAYRYNNNNNVYDTNSPSRNHDNISEYVEPALIFQMDSVDCVSNDSREVYGNEGRTKTNSEGYYTMSTDLDCKSIRKVGLERFPFEAETKTKINTSPSSYAKETDSYPDNISIISRPNNGKYYQSLAAIKNSHNNDNAENLKPKSNEMIISHSPENTTKCQDTLSTYSENKCSSSSYIQTPSPSSNTSNENPPIPAIEVKNGQIPNYNYPLYRESRGHSFPTNNAYYNMSNNFIGQSINKSYKHHYYNFSPSGQSDPVDIQPMKSEDNKLNYVTLDFSDQSSNMKVIPKDYEYRYKEINIKNTEILKDLEGYSFPKPQKKSLLKWFKNK